MKKLKTLTIAIALTALIIGTAYAGIDDGLVAYYPLDGNANDVVSGNNGIVVGATPATDRFGNADSALELEGKGLPDYMEVTPYYIAITEPQVPIGKDFTISLWVEMPDPKKGVCCYNSNQYYLLSYGSNTDFNIIKSDTYNSFQILSKEEGKPSTYFTGTTEAQAYVW